MLAEFGETMKILKQIDDLMEKALQWAWRHRKALGAGLAVLLAAWALGGREPDASPEARPQQVFSRQGEVLAGALVDRLWIDRLPKGPRDSFRLYFFLRRHPVGVHVVFHSATYRTQEFFGHQLKGKQITFDFPDPGVKPTSKVRFEAVKKDPHFDMKMTLARDPQSKGMKFSYFRLKKEEAKDLLAGYGVSPRSLAATLEAR
jgi:hypothetical protein